MSDRTAHDASPGKDGAATIPANLPPKLSPGLWAILNAPASEFRDAPEADIRAIQVQADPRLQKREDRYNGGDFSEPAVTKQKRARSYPNLMLAAVVACGLFGLFLAGCFAKSVMDGIAFDQSAGGAK